MTTSYLITALAVSLGDGSQRLQPGILLDDSKVDTTAIVNAGALLWPSSDVIVAAAASTVQRQRLSRGIDEKEAETLMQAAVNASLKANGAGVTFPLYAGDGVGHGYSFSSDHGLEAYRIGAARLGFNAGLELAFEVANATVTNTDPITPGAVRYATRNYAHPLGAGTIETCFQYLRMDHSLTDVQVGLYMELDASQSLSGGSASKVIHLGQGDAHYVALMGDDPSGPRVSGGVGYESARWADGCVGFLASNQRPHDGSYRQGNGVGLWKGFNALWESDELLRYGGFWADGFPNNAIAIVKRHATNFDGYAQFSLFEPDLQRARFEIINQGDVHLSSMPALTGTHTQASPELHFRGAYWNGSASVDRDGIIKHVVTGTTPASEFRFYLGPPGAPVLIALWQDTGTLDLQAGSLANTSSIAGPMVNIQTSGNQFDHYCSNRVAWELVDTLADGETAGSIRRRNGADLSLKKITHVDAASVVASGLRVLCIAD
jgi:hypothetical protein